jgi:Uma2 family endonuclease
MAHAMAEPYIPNVVVSLDALAELVPPDPDRVDHFVVLHGVSFGDYERFLRIRGESAVPRMTYLEGTLELMTPSYPHEQYEKMLARLLEAWADARGLMLEGVGSWTIKRRRRKRGAEPDECYVVGRPSAGVSRPDIVIEVVWTRGVIDKLEVWRKLGALEVWIWESGELAFHVLTGTRYEARPKSALLPELDPLLIAECMRAPSQTEAVRWLRERLSSPERA